MTPQNKLRVANLLMVLGIIPLLVGTYWMTSSFLALDVDKKSEVADAMLLAGRVVFAYVFAVLVGGGSALWSARLEKRHAGMRVPGSKGMRIAVAVVLVLPLVMQAF